MAELVVKLSPDLEQYEASASSAATGELGRTLTGFGARLVPVPNPVGAPAEYFLVEGFEPGDIGDLRASLERLDGVEAAYIKPSDELP